MKATNDENTTRGCDAFFFLMATSYKGLETGTATR